MAADSLLLLSANETGAALPITVKNLLDYSIDPLISSSFTAENQGIKVSW
jgi:hypothetical protein